jgi:hypothetical protein
MLRLIILSSSNTAFQNDMKRRNSNFEAMKSLLAITLVWIGAVLAISFFETPMKFTPEVITTELGVSIGRVIFFFFNKIELALSLLILILTIKNRKQMSFVLPSLVIGIVLVQTFILLPLLDKYAIEFLEFGKRGPKILHISYIGIELIKILGLGLLSIQLFKKFEFKIKS